MLTANPTPYGSLHDFGVGVTDQGKGKFELTLYPICDITEEPMTMTLDTASWGTKEAELCIYNPGVRGEDEERDRIILVTWDGKPVAYFKPYDDDGSDDLSFGAELEDEDLRYYAKTWQKIYVANCKSGEVGEGESAERNFVFITPFKTVREKPEAKCFANRDYDPFNWVFVADESGFKVKIDGGRMRYPDGSYSDIESKEFDLDGEGETTIYLRYNDTGLLELNDTEGGDDSGGDDEEDIVETKVYTFAVKEDGGVKMPYLKTDYIHSPSYDAAGGGRVELWDTKYDEDADKLKVYVGVEGTPVVRWAYDNLDFEIDPTTKTDGWLVLDKTGEIYVVVDMRSSRPIHAELTDTKPDITEGKIGIRVLTVSGNKQSRTRRHFGPYLIPAYYDSVLALWSESGSEDNFKSLSKTTASTGEDDDYRVLQLYNFDDPEEAEVANATSEEWLVEKSLQKVLVRKENEDGGAELQYATFHPLPAGDSTNKRLLWDDTLGGWIADEGDEEGSGSGGEPVLFNGRVTASGVIEIYIGKPNQPLIFFPYNNLVIIRDIGSQSGWLPMGKIVGDIYVVADFSETTLRARLTRTAPSPFGYIPSFGVKIGNFDGTTWTQMQWGPYFVPVMIDSRFGPTVSSPDTERHQSLSVVNEEAVHNKPEIPVLQLFRFDDDDYTSQMLTAGSSGFKDESVEMLVRVIGNNEKSRLEYQSFHPVPAGDATNNALEWDGSAGGWVAAPKPSGDGGGGLSKVEHDDTDSATLTGQGTLADKLKANVRVSPKTGNIVSVEAGADKGVYVPKTELQGSTSVDVSGRGTSADPYKVEAIVSSATGNALQSTAQGLFVTPGGDGSGGAVANIDVITSVKEFSATSNALKIVFGTTNIVTGVAGSDITKEITLTTVSAVATDVTYDTGARAFKKTKRDLKVFSAGTASTDTIVSLVSHASQHPSS